MAVISAHAHAVARAADEADRIEAERGLDAALGRASRLIHQLLALARLDIEHAATVTETDLAQMLRQDLAAFAPTAIARNIEISLESPDTLTARVDVLAFQSVMQNLVENAIRYGNQGGQIIVGLRRAERGITLTIADDGPGIPESDRTKVFDRFYRGSSHERSGTGLGLAIVRQAAVRLGSELNLAEGLDGRGCCFTLTVPLYA
jgi:signal transduction histidine kinase